MTHAEELALYEEALRAILAGQEYRIGSRSLRRADLEVVQKRIDYLRAQIGGEEYGTVTYGQWPRR